MKLEFILFTFLFCFQLISSSFLVKMIKHSLPPKLFSFPHDLLENINISPNGYLGIVLANSCSIWHYYDIQYCSEVLGQKEFFSPNILKKCIQQGCIKLIKSDIYSKHFYFKQMLFVLNFLFIR